MSGPYNQTVQQSRRSLRAAGQRQDTIARRSRRRWVWLSLGLIVVVLLGAGVWLAVKALGVKNDLEAARSLLLATDDSGSIEERLQEVGARAQSATAGTHDPVWTVAEYVPLLGENLRAVRVASESIEMLVNDVAVPVLSAREDTSGTPILARFVGILQSQSDPIADATAEIAESHRSTVLVGPVRAAIDQLYEVTSAAAPVLDAVPSLLGVDGPKSYLLVFQNNAESLPLGGSAASQTLITAADGTLAVTKQASAALFRNGTPVDVDVDQSALDLYSDYLVAHVNTSVSRPDFPTAANILRAFWNRDIDSAPVDAVISIDPIALGRILLATGPITVGNVQIDSSNALSVLLSDVYQWWNPYASVEEALASDAFFAGVAETVFSKLSTGDFDLKDMGWAINESISRGDILVWSDDPQLSSLIDGQRVSGVLPGDNADATTVGVFFRDTSASKIDYYMNSSIDLSESCASGSTTFTARADLHLDLTQDQADALPAYVQSAHWGADMFRTEVFVYGPPGTTFDTASVDGQNLRPLRTDVTDLGRPVAAFEVFLAPGESGSVTASFSGPGPFGPLQLRSTPMVRDTVVNVGPACDPNASE